MRIVIFNNKHKLDIDHEILYMSYEDLGVDGDDSEMVYRIKRFKPDLIIEEEKNDGKSLFSGVYQALRHIPKAWWMIDAHTNLIDHIVYAKQFDYIFCAQSWFMPIVEREVRGKVFYLPLCHTQTLTEYEEMLEIPVKKDIEFSFIGNIRSIHVERKKYIERFLATIPNFFARQSNYEDTLIYLLRSRSTFNCSLNNDLNFRVWEGIACGATVLTDHVTDIDSIKHLKNAVRTYDKLYPKEIVALYEPANDNVGWIKSNHTLTHRMNHMIGMVNVERQVNYAV